MRLEPTERALHLNRAGLALLAVGLVALEPLVATIGAALLFGVATARTWALLAVSRARAAGFEMSWQTDGRALGTRVGDTLRLCFRLSNHDRQPLRFADLEVIHSPALDVRVEVPGGEIPPGARVDVHLELRARRVGFQGVHGLWVRAVQAPGLFDVPLSFASPLVLDVLPRTTPGRLREPRSPREGHADAERQTRLPGDGGELLSLREHRAGESFRHIAWKASARRGRLLVIERERERREAVWVLLDASVEAAAGRPGEAQLDGSLERAASLARHHLEHGDRVGLVVLGTRELARVPLGRGAAQLARVLTTLSHETHTADADRSAWDEREIRRRVVEHARGLDARAQRLAADDDAAWTPLLLQLLERAPAHAGAPRAPQRTERLHRQYLLSFGIQPPPSGSAERSRVERELARALVATCAPRPRPGLVHVVSGWPAFETPRELFEALREARRLRVGVQFHAQPSLAPLPPDATDAQRLVHDALRLRLETNERWARHELTRAGATCVPQGTSARTPWTTKARSMIRRSSTLTRTFQVPKGP